MKLSSILAAAALCLFASSVSSAQEKPEWMKLCPAGRDCELEKRRTPPALFTVDDTGTVYQILGNEQWRTTKVKAVRGQKIEVVANGIVRWAPDGIEKIDVGPDGTRPPYRDGWNYKHFPFPEAGIGSLVMRVGKGVYPVGSTAVIEAEDDGEIEFMVNDDRLDDNSGGFYVRVRVN